MSDGLDLRKIVADVAAAYFRNNHVTASDIPTVIDQISRSLAAVGGPAGEDVAPEASKSRLSPAQVRQSVTSQALISFEDGKPYKTLRRHLAARGLTPEAYKAKWGLPADYPMIAPAYSAARSELAKSRGFGGRVIARVDAEPAAPRGRTKAPRRTTRRSRVAAAE
jgi:predicted transcriptional regulator